MAPSLTTISLPLEVCAANLVLTAVEERQASNFFSNCWYSRYLVSKSTEVVHVYRVNCFNYSKYLVK